MFENKYILERRKTIKIKIWYYIDRYYIERLNTLFYSNH